MNTSNGTGQISTALAKAQQDCQPAEQGGNGGGMIGKYARIEDLQKQSRKVFGENGLALLMAPYSQTVGAVGIRWRLNHISGEFIGDEFEIPMLIKKTQDLGSTLTYFRRYVLAGLLPLLAPDEDIDEVVEAEPAKKGLPKASASSRKELADAVTKTVEATTKAPPAETFDDDDDFDF